VDVLDPTAQRVLDLPIFPTTAGVSVSARRLLDDFAGSLAGRAPRARLSEEAPELLRRWAAWMLDEGRVVRPASQPVEASAPTVEPVEGLEAHAISRWLTEAIESLRPDPPTDRGRTEVIVVGDDACGITCKTLDIPPMPRRELHRLLELGGRQHLLVNSGHWMVKRFRSGAGKDQETAAWLLLSCYAFLNDYLLPVTNEHELEFQRRVLDLLDRGELGVTR
jgi:hypothetical protein